MVVKANPGDEVYSPYFDEWLEVLHILDDGTFIFGLEGIASGRWSRTTIDWYEQRDLVRSKE